MSPGTYRVQKGMLDPLDIVLCESLDVGTRKQTGLLEAQYIPMALTFSLAFSVSFFFIQYGRTAFEMMPHASGVCLPISSFPMQKIPHRNS